MADFSIRQGDTEIQNWTITDNAGAALDITGGKLWFTVKNASVLTGTVIADPGTLQLTSPSSGITILNAATGSVRMTITDTQSAAIAPQAYAFDIQFKDASGVITTLETGTLTVLAQVTSSTS